MYTTFLERMQTLYKPDKIRGLLSNRSALSVEATEHHAPCRRTLRGHDERQLDE